MAQKGNSQGESPRRPLSADGKAQIRQKLAQGYKEMSRINLMLAEEAIESSNEALSLCEQKLAECE